MMRDIYARAQCVIVFLGDGAYYRVPRDYASSPPPAPITFSSFAEDAPLINHFQESWETLCRRPEWYSFCTICVIRLLQDVEGYKDTIHCIANGKASSKLRLFELVRQFINSQWWQRVWVVQEITVPSDVVVQYGNVTVPWAILASSANVCESLGWGRHDMGFESFLGIERDHAKVLPVFTRQVFEIERLRREWEERQGTGLLSLLQEFSGRKASDDRDKVFALLGLAKNINTIEPNYSLTTIQVYRRTVIDLFKTSGSLSALSGDMKRKNSGGIASWIPDWSSAVEEPDRRRMQVDEGCKLTPPWGIELIDSEQEYWELVATNLERLHERIQERKLRPLPQDILRGLVSYKEILETRLYGTEWNDEKDLDVSQKRAVHSCRVLYTMFEEDCPKFWSVISVRSFIESHLALPHIPSSGERYRLDIIRWCARMYCSRVLDLWFQKLKEIEQQRTTKSQFHSVLSKGEKEKIVADHNWHFHADDIIRNGWSWHQYTHKAIPTLVEFIRDRLVTKMSLTGEGRVEFMLLASEVTTSFDRERILTDSTTFLEACVGSEQLETLSDLIYLASEVLKIRTGSSTLLAIERTRIACTSLIMLHQNNSFHNSGQDYVGLYSTAVVFYGKATWMRWLRNDFNFTNQQSLEWRRKRQHEALLESKNVLHISSRLISTVDRCSERLITWVDQASRISTIGRWAKCALQFKDRGSSTHLTLPFLFCFATTLVGGLYEVCPGKFRPFRGHNQQWSLKRWFQFSLLPQLHDTNPVVANAFHWILKREGVSEAEPDVKKSFDTEMRLASEGRVFFTTPDQRMGLGPGSMRTGDEIRVLPGGNRPFVLRRHTETGASSIAEYEVIGDCFILEKETDVGKGDLLQGCLPEILAGLLPKKVGYQDITLR